MKAYLLPSPSDITLSMSSTLITPSCSKQRNLIDDWAYSTSQASSSVVIKLRDNKISKALSHGLHITSG